jgi:hypothetical protein
MELGAKVGRSSRILKTWGPCMIGLGPLKGKTRWETQKSSPIDFRGRPGRAPEGVFAIMGQKDDFMPTDNQATPLIDVKRTTLFWT